MSCSKVYWDNLYKKLKRKNEITSEQNEKGE
jgi:hypothetical protein